MSSDCFKEFLKRSLPDFLWIVNKNSDINHFYSWFGRRLTDFSFKMHTYWAERFGRTFISSDLTLVREERRGANRLIIRASSAVVLKDDQFGAASSNRERLPRRDLAHRRRAEDGADPRDAPIGFALVIGRDDFATLPDGRPDRPPGEVLMALTARIRHSNPTARRPPQPRGAATEGRDG